MRTPLATLAVAVLAIVVGASSVGAVDLLPHRAGYRMSLSHASQSSGLAGAQGAMVYQFGKLCDGWTVENRTFLRLNYRGGEVVETRWTFASWESADGRAFRFRGRFEQQGRVTERIRGHAALEADGGRGSAWLTLPDETEIPLPPGTLFPTQHMKALIAAAERGEAALTHVVFDGASVDNPYLVSAVFGPLAEPAAADIAKATGLAPGPAWWSRLAFFPVRGTAQDPEFELGARYRADGVADRISQHFKEFSLDVVLDEFDALPPPDC